jgi:hypothetical protein
MPITSISHRCGYMSELLDTLRLGIGPILTISFVDETAGLGRVARDPPTAGSV